MSSTNESVDVNLTSIIGISNDLKANITLFGKRLVDTQGILTPVNLKEDINIKTTFMDKLRHFNPFFAKPSLTLIFLIANGKRNFASERFFEKKL